MVLTTRARTMMRAVGMLFIALAFGTFAVGPTRAQSITYISGTVTVDGTPTAGAAVSLSGANITRTTQSGAGGTFGFNALPIGTYNITATAGGRSASTRVDLTSGGATVTVAIAPLAVIGRTAQTFSAVQARRAGTDLTLTGESLRRAPSVNSFSETLLQVPGAARGANGVVHINGDHGDINYIVDGVALPQELNRAIGSEVDPSNVAYAEVLEGAYPAQYGERFGAVVNIGSRGGNGPPGATLDAEGGSYGYYDSTVGYHTPIGSGGSLALAIRNEMDGRALDPPQPDYVHDRSSTSNQFLRLTLPNGNDYVNLTFTHSLQTYQIPPDLADLAPSKQDDNQKQDDLFASIQYRHPIGDHGALSFGPSVKRSHLLDTPDFGNDIAFGIANGGAADCSGSFNDPTIPSCSQSVFADRTSTDYRFNVDYALRSDRHEIRAGTVYDLTNVTKNYAITLQPNNPYSALPYTISDTSPNTGHTEEAYIQDSWRMGTKWQLDYGVRYDTFALFSDQFHVGSAQFSPRVKLTHYFTPRASIYAYYGRFFTPYAFENVSPRAAMLLFPQSGNFDLLPQRDSVYELGFHVPAGSGDLGVRIMQKNATDLIDDVQVGFTNLHQDINYREGRIGVQSLLYQRSLARAGRVYASISHAYSVVKDCETQLLAPCFSGPALDWIPADHDQRWDVNGGFLVNDAHRGWWAFSGEYGSGLTSVACMPLNDNCKVPPHLTFDAEKGVGFAGGAVTLRVLNLLNDRYFVTYRNAQGNHFARPRTFQLGVTLGGPGH